MLKPKNKKILFITCTHGDEDESLDVILKLKNTKYGDNFDYIIANPKAYEARSRFVSSDLNRLYPGVKYSKIYEKKIAWKNLETAKKYKYVIDLHSASQSKDDFIIIPQNISKTIPLINHTNLNKIVIWPSTSARTTGPISQFLRDSIEIEFGSKGLNRNLVCKKIEKSLKYLLGSIQESNNTVKNNKKYFYVYDKLLIINNNQKTFNNIKGDFKKINYNNETFYSLLTDQYLSKGIKCYKMRPVKLDI